MVGHTDGMMQLGVCFRHPCLSGAGKPLSHSEGCFIRTFQAPRCAQCVTTGPSAELSFKTEKAISFSFPVLWAPHSHETMGIERGSVPYSL